VKQFAPYNCLIRALSQSGVSSDHCTHKAGTNTASIAFAARTFSQGKKKKMAAFT